MRWILVAAMVAGCGVTDTADVSLTVVNVHLTPSCTDPSTCYETIELWPFCGDTMPVIEADTDHILVTSGYEPDEVTGIVQLQYTGAVSRPDYDHPHIDYVLAGAPESVWAAYTDYVEPQLYDIDGEGHASNIDLTKRTAVDGATLRFEYRGVVEEHTVNPPRTINIETEEGPPCCSAGRPLDLGMIFALVLVPWRKRRKRRAC